MQSAYLCTLTTKQEVKCLNHKYHSLLPLLARIKAFTNSRAVTFMKLS